MDRAFLLDDSALLVFSCTPGMLFHQINPLHSGPILLWENRDNLSGLAAVLSDQHPHCIVFLYLSHISLYIASGAREIIFIKFFSRNSLATGPKILVPRGFFCGSMITIALVSNLK